LSNQQLATSNWQLAIGQKKHWILQELFLSLEFLDALSFRRCTSGARAGTEQIERVVVSSILVFWGNCQLLCPTFASSAVKGFEFANCQLLFWHC